ncbi:outer membrane beta-barrel family protein [Bacteroides ihuae]|uniref:outer membrane beta-barrel family protein n=1 Tax=Bacteroides ihuae TaxID=1852362 RepID=UPI0008D9DB15|nr:outer membrane beta-barrel family protein [Bacteroides ihuae]
MDNYFFKLLLLLPFCFTTQLHSQSIAGRIVDENDFPLEYVNIVLLSLPDSSYVNGTVSDQNGLFNFKEDCGDKIMKISAIGYSTVYKQCLDPELRKIRLSSQVQLLDSIVVKANLPRTRFKDDAFITNIENTILSKAGSLNDVLSKIPSIIKKEKTFEVFGKGVPLIYLNGRVIREISELEQINSEDIKEVELITNPGSRYDASVKAVIRIKTLKIQGEGFSFDLRSSYSQSYNVDLVNQLNLNYRYKGLDVFGTFKFDKNAYEQRSNIEQTVWVDTCWSQTNTNTLKGNYKRYRTLLGFNYTLNEKHSFGAQYTMTLSSNYYDHSITNSIVHANNLFYDSWYSDQNTETKSKPVHLLNMYYVGKINDLNIEFNADYYFNKKDVSSYTTENSQEMEDREIHSINNVKNSLFASKLVFSYPLFNGDFSVGSEYSHTKRNDKYINQENYVPTSSSLIKESGFNVFAEYKRSFSLGQLSLGLRYERLYFKYYENDEYVKAQSKHFNNYFPTISFSRNFGPIHTQLSYTAKTKRPSYQQLSNNVFYLNRFTLSSGNPALKSEIIHDITLNNAWRFLQLMVSYQEEHDAIIYWSEQMESNSAVTLIKYKNINKLPCLTAYLSATPKLGIWSPQIGLGIQKQWLKIENNNKMIKLNTPLISAMFANMIELPWTFSFSVDFSYQGDGDVQNIYLSEKQFILNLGVRKSLFKDKLSLEFKVNDLFHGATSGNLAYMRQLLLSQLNKYDSRECVLTLRYKLNSAKNKYRGTNVSQQEINRL